MFLSFHSMEKNPPWNYTLGVTPQIPISHNPHAEMRMKNQPLLLALFGCFLMVALLSHAGNIVLVRMGGSAYPNDAITFPDQTNRFGVWTEQQDIGFTNT